MKMHGTLIEMWNGTTVWK